MKDVKSRTLSELTEAVEDAVHHRAPPSLEIDLEYYQACLDDPDLSLDQRREITAALWTIISAFIQLGFDVHPAQQACGKTRTELEQTSFSESTGVQSDQSKQPDEEAPAL